MKNDSALIIESGTFLHCDDSATVEIVDDFFFCVASVVLEYSCYGFETLIRTNYVQYYRDLESSSKDN